MACYYPFLGPVSFVLPLSALSGTLRHPGIRLLSRTVHELIFRCPDRAGQVWPGAVLRAGLEMSYELELARGTHPSTRIGSEISSDGNGIGKWHVPSVRTEETFYSYLEI